VRVESKEDIALRLHRSTDVGDAVVLANFQASGTGVCTNPPLFLGGGAQLPSAGPLGQSQPVRFVNGRPVPISRPIPGATTAGRPGITSGARMPGRLF
jgi:hypothetical protein